MEPGRIARARKAGLPRTLEPELATPAKAPPGGAEWLHEIKYDGYRFLSFIREGKVRLISRSGKDWTGKFSRVVAALEALNLPDSVLDGEIAAVEESGKTRFNRLRNAVELGDEAVNLRYFLFDLPFFDGYDLRQSALADRKECLRRVLSEAGESPAVRYSDHIQGDGARVFKEACRMGLEGIVSKRASSPYVSSRTRSWLKVKCQLGQEFVIAGYTEPQGSRAGFGALMLGYYDGGALVYCGKVGTGFDEAALESISGQLRKLVTRDSPFARSPVPNEKGIHWVRPELVCRVVFGEWTGDGHLRHPSFQGMLLDRVATEVRREA